jgi:hypothetical protein
MVGYQDDRENGGLPHLLPSIRQGSVHLSMSSNVSSLSIASRLGTYDRLCTLEVDDGHIFQVAAAAFKLAFGTRQVTVVVIHGRTLDMNDGRPLCRLTGDEAIHARAVAHGERNPAAIRRWRPHIRILLAGKEHPARVERAQVRVHVHCRRRQRAVQHTLPEQNAQSGRSRRKKSSNAVPFPATLETSPPMTQNAVSTPELSVYVISVQITLSVRDQPVRFASSRQHMSAAMATSVAVPTPNAVLTKFCVCS